LIEKVSKLVVVSQRPQSVRDRRQELLPFCNTAFDVISYRMALPSSVHSLDRSSLSFVSRKNRLGHQQFGQPSVAVQSASAVHLLRIYLCQHIWGQQQHLR
jgi:hypothetical protein